MKTLSLALAASLAASALFASIGQAQQAPKVPTGYEVSGCTWFEIKDNDGKVRQICKVDSAEAFIQAQVNPADPRAFSRGTSSGGAGGSGE